MVSSLEVISPGFTVPRAQNRNLTGSTAREERIVYSFLITDPAFAFVLCCPAANALPIDARVLRRSRNPRSGDARTRVDGRAPSADRARQSQGARLGTHSFGSRSRGRYRPRGVRQA